MTTTTTQYPNTADIILALDLPTRDEALSFLDKVGSELSWVKVGLQLFTRYGPSFVEELKSRNLKIFLDLKLHDIPNTIASAVRNLSHLNIQMLTLHTLGGLEMLQAAQEARTETSPELHLLGVTVLTSMDRESLTQIGIANPVGEQVIRLANLASNAKLSGVVCSPLELNLLQQSIPPEMLRVTPGIRPEGSNMNEQKRVMGPAEASEKGAHYLVMGRPILQAENPAQKVRDIYTSMRGEPANV